MELVDGLPLRVFPAANSMNEDVTLAYDGFSPGLAWRYLHLLGLCIWGKAERWLSPC